MWSSTHVDDLFTDAAGVTGHDQHLNSLAYDGYGKLYVVNRGGDLTVSSVKQRMLTGPWSQSSQENKLPTRHQASKAVRMEARPALTALPGHIAVSCDGSYAAVAGPCSQDPERSAIAVLDVRSSGVPSSAVADTQLCECSSVDERLYRSRPGLRILQIAWHPESSRHLAVLTNDNTWRLYCVDDLSVPEQTFHLLLRANRSVGLCEASGQQAVAFCFGQGPLWQNFTVYFLCSSGAIYLLCPVAPFGGHCPVSTAEELLACVREEEEDQESLTTLAWLQQVFNAPLAEAPPDVERDSRGPLSKLRAKVRPHALQEHVPLLQGPLEVTSPDGELLGLMELAPEDDFALSLAASRSGADCTILTVCTASGLLGCHLIAHQATPEWAASIPHCVVDDSVILAVRSQVPVSDRCTAELLLLTAAQSGVLVPADVDEEELWTGPPPVRLISDPVVPERLYCLHQQSAHVLSLPWLAALTAQLSDWQSSLSPLPDFGSTAVEELWASGEGGPHCVGATVVGDAVTGTALLILLSDGHSHCLWPSRQGSHVQHHTIIGSNTSAAVNAQINAVYRDLLRGPRNLSMPRLTGNPLSGQPEGQRALTDSIRALREKHVEFLHQAHHDLLKRLEEASSAADVQEARSKQLKQAATAVERRGQRLHDRLQRAAQWNDNLQARLKLLTELHWSLPHTLSASEKIFKDVELPRLEKEMRSLERTLKELRKRADAANGNTSIKMDLNGVPASQIRGVRAALVEQTELISLGQQLLGMLEIEIIGQEGVLVSFDD